MHSPGSLLLPSWLCFLNMALTWSQQNPKCLFSFICRKQYKTNPWYGISSACFSARSDQCMTLFTLWAWTPPLDLPPPLLLSRSICDKNKSYSDFFPQGLARHTGTHRHTDFSPRCAFFSRLWGNRTLWGIIDAAWYLTVGFVLWGF